MRSNRLSYSPGKASIVATRRARARAGSNAGRCSIQSRAVKAFRRVLLVFGLAGLVGLIARLRGKGGVPPTSGGWRELEAPEFR